MEKNRSSSATAAKRLHLYKNLIKKRAGAGMSEAKLLSMLRTQLRSDNSRQSAKTEKLLNPDVLRHLVLS